MVASLVVAWIALGLVVAYATLATFGWQRAEAYRRAADHNYHAAEQLQRENAELAYKVQLLTSAVYTCAPDEPGELDVRA